MDSLEYVYTVMVSGLVRCLFDGVMSFDLLLEAHFHDRMLLRIIGNECVFHCSSRLHSIENDESNIFIEFEKGNS